MELSAKDYRRLITARTEEISNEVWGNNAPQPIGYHQQDERVPDFDKLKTLLDEISELASAYEASIGPG